MRIIVHFHVHLKSSIILTMVGRKESTFKTKYLIVFTLRTQFVPPFHVGRTPSHLPSPAGASVCPLGCFGVVTVKGQLPDCYPLGQCRHACWWPNPLGMDCDL